jgi:hypothetical protein
MKYKIDTKVTKTYSVLFDAPNKETANRVEDKIRDHLADYPDPTLLPAEIEETRLCKKLGVKNMVIKELVKPSKAVTEALSMEKEDLEIRDAVEWWDGNLNTFEIYDTLKDEYTSSQQVKLINYAKEYFHNCKELSYQLQDMADTLGVDLDEEV